MRALLDLMRNNKTTVHGMLAMYQALLRKVSANLKILDPEHGDEELIELVAAELAKLSILRQSGALVLCITHTPVLTPTSPLKRWEIFCS